ncbi:MAG: DUF2914 domain-containing protein [Deltaproteobacteria bacterium]|nr:DUF2914 domain-containing protein [Deltaproteobacteria bacterium]
MKTKVSFSSVVIWLMCLSLLIPAAGAQQTDKLDVEAAAICEGVDNREAVNVGTRFTNSTPRLYCFTKIVGAESPTEVVHVWSYGDVERARISLAVNASNWRTYSSKAIQAHEIGAWRVEVLDTSGNLLETINFEITQ